MCCSIKALHSLKGYWNNCKKKLAPKLLLSLIAKTPGHVLNSQNTMISLNMLILALAKSLWNSKTEMTLDYSKSKRVVYKSSLVHKDCQQI